jgi:hypothetical protein
MKKINALLSVAFVVLTACQPQDVSLAPANSNGGNVSGNSANSSGNDYNQLIAYSIDRQVEAVFLLKAALNSDYALSQKLDVSKNSQAQVTSFKNNAAAKSSYNINFEVSKLEVDANGLVSEVILKNSSSTQSTAMGQVNGKSFEFSAKPLIEYISIQKTANPDEYVVSIDRVDETNHMANGQSFIDLNATFILTWDGLVSSLDKEIKIAPKSLTIDRKGNKKASMRFDPGIKSNLLVKLDSCVSVNGDVEFKQTIKGKQSEEIIITNVKFNDSSMSMTAKQQTYEYTAKDCSTRQVLDVAKLL